NEDVGDHAVTLTLTDGVIGTPVTQSFTVTVSNVNDDPVARDDLASTSDGEPREILVLDNDYDVDGDDLTITSVTEAAHGTTSISGDAIVYTPGDDFSGADIFDYTISDGQGGSASATVTVLVDLGDETISEDIGPDGGEITSQSGTSINIPPGALDDTVTIIIGEFAEAPVGPELAGVLYFYGPTGLQFNFPVPVTVPYDLAMIPEGISAADLVLVIYNEGTDEWSVADSNEVNEIALTLTGWITHFSGFGAGQSANQAPYSLMSLPDRQILEDTIVDTLISNLGEYFADRDDDPLTFTATTADTGLEALFILNEQALIVVLTPNFYGIVNIEVTATDPDGASARETLVLEILPVNDAPQFISFIPDISIPEDVILYQISMAVIMAAVFDADGDPLTFSVTSDTSAVIAAVGDTSLSFAPAANWNGKASIVLTAMDGQASAQDTFTLTIIPVNDLPTAFELLTPASGNSLIIQADDPDTSILFTWEPSSDPDDGDSVSYIFIIWQEDTEFELSQPVGEPELHVLREPVVTLMRDNGMERANFLWEVGAVSGSDTTWNTDGPSSLEIDLSTLAVVSDSHLPQLFALHQNYPNPFNPVTTLHYELPMQSHVRLVIYDIRGREIIRLVDRYESAGFKKVSWNSSDYAGRPVPTAIYFARLVTAEYTHTIKMTLIR
ncbi:MAG: tandem-95 repeat protein, partial [Candidatus Marinimicrobia bacterium]|nr:tandem-95 repeat protein [Candidatus Neomarinimicrobiota bacterium]